MNRFTRNSKSLFLVAAVLLAGGCGKTASKNNGDASGGKVYTNPKPQQSGGQQNAADNGPAESTTGQPSAASDTGQASAVKGQAVAEPAAPIANQPSAAAQPALASISVPAGTVLSVRLSQALSVKRDSTGERFSGSIASPVRLGGAVVIPAGSRAEGIVLRAHRRGRFKGRSVLQLKLTGLEVNGQRYQIDTRDFIRGKKGKGRRTAAFIGGGSGLGMLIGGVATGGVGLVVGGLAGAGAGTLGAAFTGNRDIRLPAESVISFKLAGPLYLH